jgi:hypothetical protein
MSAGNESRRSAFAWGAILVLGVLVIYAKSAGYEYLRLDDHDYTFLCPFVKDGLSWGNVREAFCNLVHGCIWMPLTYISYMAVISMFGEGAGPQHALCTLLHAANAVLFYMLLLRMSRTREGGKTWVVQMLCFAAAAFWAWHPMRCESVAWIASRKDVMVAFFSLAGLNAWSVKRWGWGWVFCALACMCKPAAMVFPCFAACVEMFSASRDWNGWRRASLRYAPLFVMGVATGLLAMYSQTSGGQRSLFYAPLGWRLLNAAVSVGLEMWHTVLPTSLHIVYRPMYGEWPQGSFVGLATLAVVSGGVGFAVWRAARPGPGRRGAMRVLVCALWFLVGIAPTLGIAADFGDHAYADRFTYMPAMGFSMLVLAFPFAERLINRASCRARAVIVTAVVAVYGCAAFVYADTFRDNFSLFKRVVDCDWGHPAGNLILGIEYAIRKGEVDKGIEYVRKSFLFDPKEECGAELVYLLAKRGLPEDDAEVKRICAALATEPERDAAGRATAALGIVALREGNIALARRMFEHTVHVGRPDDRARAAKALESLSGPMKEAAP